MQVFLTMPCENVVKTDYNKNSGFYNIQAKNRPQAVGSRSIQDIQFALFRLKGIAPQRIFYSHSTVAGGLLVTSYTTRLMCLTSLVIRLETFARRS